jgi:hypothetical protein
VVSGTGPEADENTGDVSGGGVAAHDHIGVAALVKIRIEDRLAGRAPARWSMPQRARTAQDSPVNIHCKLC